MNMQIATVRIGALISSLLSATLISGCGGGGGSTPVAPPATAKASSEVVASAPSTQAVADAGSVTLTGSRASIYRFYNTRTNSHFYTMSAEERDMVIARFPQFNYEGVGFTAYAAPQPGLSPVYRFYNVKTGTHFYTIGEAERDSVINTLSATYTYEGPAWYAATGGEGLGTPMYRFYNASTGTHFYTISAEEEANVRLRFPQFTPEGIGYYAWLAGPVTPPILLPAAPVDLARALVEWNIDPSGVGGDAGGDGGVGGTAGDGSPLRGVTVVLKDATPLPPPPDPNAPPAAPPRDPEVARGTTDANGRFLLKFKTANIVPPLVLQVTDAGGNVLASTTEETVPAGKAVRINVNPLTDKITSDVLTTNVGSTDKRYVGSQVDLSKLAAAKRDLVASTTAALGVAGISDTSNFDPVRSIYQLDGTGVDAVIESISHSREPTTGATQLRTKLTALQTNGNGSVTPSLITAASPLSTDAVAVASNPALTFAKITAWMNEMNRCFAMSSVARAADANCVDLNGTRLVSRNFRDNGKDLAETYRTLYSESNLSAVQGSTLSNPAILFNMPGSASPPEPETTLVEFTVDQPRTGPLAGSRTGAIRYTTTMSFVTTSSSGAVAGNWILGGNQNRFDASIQPGYEGAFQAHSSFRTLFPDTLATLLEIRISPSSFNTATRSYVSANIRAARVKGPGLPDPGLVLSPSSGPGASRYLTPHNKNGDPTLGGGANSTNQPIFFLSMVKAANSPPTTTLNAYWTVPNPRPSFADAPQTDFSSMQAYSRYTIEYFLNGNATLTPDLVETTRILAPVMPPSYLDLLPHHNTHADLQLFFAGSPGGCSFTLQWYNDLQAAPVDSAFITDGTNIINMDVDALAAVRPNSATRDACSGPDAATISPINTNGTSFRKIGAASTNARFRIYSAVRYN